MRICIVHIGDVLLCPPVMNLMNMLEEMGVEGTLISTKSDIKNNFPYKHIDFFELPIQYEAPRNMLLKFTDMFRLRKVIWREIDRRFDENDLIWLTSNVTLKHVGERITKRKYILQLMELSEQLRYHKRLPLKMDAHKIGNSALAVVVPEYNRAHIVKAWWELDHLPLILENKPYATQMFDKHCDVEDETAREVLEKLKGKKIILYQGITHRERPLDQYIYAVDKLGDEYAFVVMSSENAYKDIQSKNYYFIPYVKPPYHLQITSHAYIGVLSYFPVKTNYSILNALYCAPNKTYEYAMFGAPMIGNDNPGLKFLFETTHAGVCIEDFTVDNICEAIKKIESDYDVMSDCARSYYYGTDTKAQLTKILSVAKERM